MPQWWTEADQAEADLVAYTLVEALAGHWVRDKDCCGRGLCPAAIRAIGIAEAWTYRRALTSRAQYLRVEHEVAA